MKKVNKKLAVALLALTCASCAAVAGVSMDKVPAGSAITASADALVQHNIGALQLHVNSQSFGGAGKANNQLYLQRADGEALPFMSWDYLFTADTDGYFLINGEAKTPSEIKSTDAGFFWLFDALNAGDVVTIGGKFKCESQGIIYNVVESKFTWNGTNWEEYTPPVQYTTYTFNKLAGANGCAADVIYAYPTAGDTLPSGDWDNEFALESGDGFKLNGNVLSDWEMKQPGDLYIKLSAPASAGDKLTIDGTFYNAKVAKKFVFTNCVLVFDGTTWKADAEEVPPVEPEEPEVDYPDCNLGKLFVSGGDNKDIYFKPVDESVRLTVNSWTDEFAYVSGNGITVNGTMISMENSVKSPEGSFFANLGAPAQEGDILKVGGVFRCEGGKADYVIEDREFQWTGSEWKVYGEEIVYTEYKLGVMSLAAPSKDNRAQAGQLYLNQENGEALPIPDSSWKTIFVYESGDGLKVNGNAATLAEMKSTDAGLFLGFAGVNVGDIVSISGTFICDGKAARYVIEESEFVWNGKAWQKYIAYQNYDIGSVISIETSTAQHVYLHPVQEVELPVNSWDQADAFAYGSGNGITLNGEMINMVNSVKSVEGNIFIDLGKAATAGDILVIGGEFCSEGKAIKYTVTETKFVFDGKVWLNELGVAKRDNKVALDEYRATFAEADYYEAEWASFDKIVEESKAKIDSATTIEETKLALEAAKAAMDEVVTKEEADAIFEGLKDTAAADLAAYKAEADYREAEWTEIQAIVVAASAEIKAAESVTAINTAVNAAKAAMDALKTKAMWEADEAAVATAKADLAAYKTEEDYRDAEWTAIQAIITEANTAIDGAIGNQEGIDGIVAAAKTEMDAIKTSAQWEADEAVVTVAKNELDGYVAEADYREAEWTAIQAIIAEAKTAIDGAIGDEAAITEIVSDAKAAMDEVLTASEAAAAELAAAKEAAKAEVRAYYNAIDHDKYSEEAEVTLSGFVATAISAIDAATAIADVEAVVAQFKTNVDGVDQIQDSTSGSDSGKTTSGCSSVVGGMATVAMAAAAAAALLRKKKED